MIEAVIIFVSTIYVAAFDLAVDYNKQPTIEDQVRSILYSEGGYMTPDVNKFLQIAYYESRMKPNAQNSNSTAGGLFQILDSTWKNYGCVGKKYSVEDNTKCAIKIQKGSGWRPWEVCNKKLVNC